MMMVNSQSIIALNWKWLKVLLTRFLRFWFSCVCVNIDFPPLSHSTQRLGAVHSQQVDVIQRNLTPSLAIPPLILSVVLWKVERFPLLCLLITFSCCCSLWYRSKLVDDLSISKYFYKSLESERVRFNNAKKPLERVSIARNGLRDSSSSHRRSLRLCCLFQFGFFFKNYKIRIENSFTYHSRSASKSSWTFVQLKEY